MAGIGNLRGSEVCAIVSTIDPAATTTVRTGDWVDAASWEQLMFILLGGDAAADSTIDFKLEQATSSGGAGAKDLVAATQRAAHATTNDNIQTILETRAEELDHANGFRYVRPSILGAAATGFIGGVLGLGFNSRYGVGTDLATVVEIKQA